jgi:hypothetical protein
VIKELDPRVRPALVLMSSKDPSNAGRARGIEVGGPSLNVDVSKADLSSLSTISSVLGLKPVQRAWRKQLL